MKDSTRFRGPIYEWKLMESDDSGSKVLLVAIAYKGEHRLTFTEAQNIIKVLIFFLCVTISGLNWSCFAGFNLFLILIIIYLLCFKLFIPFMLFCVIIRQVAVVSERPRNVRRTRK